MKKKQSPTSDRSTKQLSFGRLNHHNVNVGRRTSGAILQKEQETKFDLGVLRSCCDARSSPRTDDDDDQAIKAYASYLNNNQTYL